MVSPGQMGAAEAAGEKRTRDQYLSELILLEKE